MPVDTSSTQGNALSSAASSAVKSLAGLPERALLILAAMLAWGLFVALKGPIGWGEMTNTGVMDNDGLMRLAQVRDLLSGQAFYDLTQSRMNAPFGLEMHWSRLIDLSIAALIVLGSFLLGPELGEPFAMTVWPLLVLLPTLVAICFVSRELGGTDAVLPCLVFALASPRTVYFLPGQIDHHNIQIMLCLFLVVSVVISQRLPKMAAAAGALVALTLSIGLETIAYALICAAWYPALWIIKGQQRTKHMVHFAFGLLAATLLLTFGLFVPASGFQAYCDVFSFAYAPALAIGATGLLVLAKTSHTHDQWPTRLAAATALGATCVLSIAAIAPECLQGPYAALTPELRTVWFNLVKETQSAQSMFENDLKSALAYYPYLAFAVACGIWVVWHAMRNDPDRVEGLAFLLIMLSTGCLLGLVQVRAVGNAAFFAIPVFAVFAAIVRGIVNDNGQTSRGLLVLIFAWVLGTNAAWTIMANHAFGKSNENLQLAQGSAGCGLPHDLASLDRYSSGVVVNGVDLGPWIVAHTKHAAISGPYHRNEKGILEAYKALTSEPQAARKLIAARGGDYLAWCAASAGGDVLKQANAKGLVAQIESGTVPNWLRPITDPSETGLRLFQVVRAPGLKQSAASIRPQH